MLAYFFMLWKVIKCKQIHAIHLDVIPSIHALIWWASLSRSYVPPFPCLLRCHWGNYSFSTFCLSERFNLFSLIFCLMFLDSLIPLLTVKSFSMLLQGMTTYEYVVAMRTQSEPPAPSVNLEQQSIPSTPNSSAATAVSESSLGLQYRGAWCTPPRGFVDQLVFSVLSHF